jgi:phage gp29-like protein
MEAWLETIEAMLEAASSLEEFREMLLAAWPELSTDKLEEAMTQAFVAMDLRGQAEVADEAGVETAEGA